jgi:hypothetical protein
MAKKKVTQKQKQSQKTIVNVKVGDTKRRSVARRRSSAPVQRIPTGISLTLQGSSVALPQVPYGLYNESIANAEALRRQMALSGQLIPQRQTNDLLNRVEATNPFANISNVVPVGSLLRPEQLQQQVVDGATTQNAYQSRDQSSASIPLDQDFIRNLQVSNLSQSFAGVANKIGATEDVESIRDISNYDRQNISEQEMLQRSVLRRNVTSDLDEFIAGARQRQQERQRSELKAVRAARKAGKPVIFEENK